MFAIGPARYSWGYSAFCKALKERDDIIAQQKATISRLEEKVQRTVKNAKNMRENRLYNIFMEKYQEEYELRTSMEK